MNKIFTDIMDKNGIRLKDGDIIAEGKVGEIIWDGAAIIMRRPLGLLKVTPEGGALVPIRTGYVLFVDKPKEETPAAEGEAAEGETTTEEQKPSDDNVRIGQLFLSMQDGVFTHWEAVEKIASVDSFVD